MPQDLDMVRSDRIIATVLDLPRNEVRRIIDGGGATIAGASLRPAQQLPAGTEVCVAIPEPVDPARPEPVDFAVVHEDADLIVVDKPPGLVVHPGAGTTDPTLVSGLVYRYPELGGLADHRWGLVHRLDRDTSGLLVVARNAATHSMLQEALRRRAMTRVYLALVSGQLEAATGTIEAPIGRDPANPTRQALRHDGRHAVTHYRRLATWEDVALVEVTLETGRTHQIRVHFAGIDHHVVGDRLYGTGARLRGDPGRQWLHAHRLEFAHPSSGAVVAATSGLPEDLAATLPGLGSPSVGSVADLT